MRQRAPRNVLRLTHALRRGGWPGPGVSPIFGVLEPMAHGRFHLVPGGNAGDARQAEELLRTAARQQGAVAHLGQQALAGAPIATLLDTASELLTRGLEVELSEILEFHADRRSLSLRAGVGWREGQVGRVLVSAEPGTL